MLALFTPGSWCRELSPIEMVFSLLCITRMETGGSVPLIVFDTRELGRTKKNIAMYYTPHIGTVVISVITAADGR